MFLFLGVNPSSAFSSSAGNVNHNPRLSVRHEDPYVLTKTHSATNVFSRAPNANPLRNSLDTIGTQFAVQYSEISDRNSENNNRGHFESAAYRTNNYSENNGANASELVRNAKPQAFDRYVMRRGSSVENLNAGSMDVNANGTMKKLRFENEVSVKLSIIFCCLWPFNCKLTQKILNRTVYFFHFILYVIM